MSARRPGLLGHGLSLVSGLVSPFLTVHPVTSSNDDRQDHVTSVDWSPKNYTLATGGWDRRRRQMRRRKWIVSKTQKPMVWMVIHLREGVVGY